MYGRMNTRYRTLAVEEETINTPGPQPTTQCSIIKSFATEKKKKKLTDVVAQGPLKSSRIQNV